MDKYFDLHISGLGYLSRAREVKPKRSNPFLAVDVTAIHGHADDVQRVRFDAKVAGSEAQKVIRDLMDDDKRQGPQGPCGLTSWATCTGHLCLRQRRPCRPDRHQPQDPAAPAGLGQGGR